MSTSTSGTGSAALVHDWLTGMRGGEMVLQAFCRILTEAPIFTLLHRPGSVSAEIESHPIHTSFLQKAWGWEKHYRGYLPVFPSAIESFDLTAFPLVVSLSHCVAKGIVPGPTARHICYCFTPMRYAWDQEHIYFPKRRGVVARLRSLALSYLRTWDVASTKRVTEFVTISRFVADRIRSYYGREASVVAPPVDVDFFTPGPAAEGQRPYALCVAALVPYKRIPIAMEACARLGLDLVIVGQGPEKARLEKLQSPGARFPGHVTREELRDLYRNAICMVQPGVEDFGIASVESLACGTPVVAVGRGGVVDIVDPDVHGILVQAEGNPEALATAIDKIQNIGSNTLELRGRAESFSMSRFLKEIEALLGRQKHTDSEGAPS